MSVSKTSLSLKNLKLLRPNSALRSFANFCPAFQQTFFSFLGTTEHLTDLGQLNLLMVVRF